MTRGRIPIIKNYAKTDLVHLKVDPYGGAPSSQATPAGDFFGNIPAAVRSERLRFSYKHPRTLVTFTFDDGMATDYTIMKPVFDAQGEVAVSNIVTDRVGGATYMTWAQIKELQTDGWEITSHTHTHANLTTLTEAQIRVEFETSIALLEAQGLVINNLAYPGNASNVLARRVAKDYFRSARGGGTAINPIVLDTYNLRSRINDDHTLGATYQALVDTAETNGTWLIFYAHATDANDAATMNTLIDYIQAKNIPIVTINQALDLVENVIDIGDGFSVGEGGVRADLKGSDRTVELGVLAGSHMPVVSLTQGDVTEGFINFIGSDRGVIGEGTNSTVSVRVELGGVVYRLALYADA